MAMMGEDKEGAETAPPHSYQEKSAPDKEPGVHRTSPAISPLPQEKALSRLPLLPSNASLSLSYYGVDEDEVKYIFDNSSDIVVLFEEDRCTRINKVFRDITGWTEEEIKPFIGNPFTAPFTHPEDVQTVLNIFEIAKKSKSVWCYESRIQCKDNSYRWIQWLSLAKNIPSMEPPRGQTLFCIGHDITQQKAQEQARIKELAESHKILRAISEIQSAYIQRKNHPSLESKSEEDTIALYYKTFELAVQYFIDLSESEFGFIGRIFYDEGGQPFIRQVFGIRENLPINEQQQQTLNMYKGEGRKLCKFDNILGDLIATKEALIINDIHNYPKTVGVPEGHPFPINSFLGIPFIFNNEVLGIVALANRIEEYNNDLLQWLDPLSLVVGRIMNEFKMENWLQEAEEQAIARKQAEASNAAKSAFLAHMSHEIRTPLTGILGFLDLINSESLSKEDCNYLKDAQASGWSLMTILNDILDASKIEANQIELEKVELNPIKIVQEVIQLLSIEAKKQGTALATIINPETPSSLMGDPTRLRQVCFNLIGNAVKFTKKGTVSVALDGKNHPEKKNIFLLKGSVTDNGIGMAPETQQRLFKSFSQADQSMMRQFGGSGLGLYITKKLCELMNGDVKVQSQLGVGSTFQFTVEMGIPEEKVPALAATVEKQSKLPKLHILIAEDNRVSQVFLKTLLTREGCSTTIVENGQEAIDAVQKEHYDLVLMDGEMPEMDGLEATRRIREVFDSQSLPIIGVTAHALDLHQKRFLSSGMNGYLTKPLRKEALKAEILRCLKCKER
jgi:PAS domain S-box-containing protein